MKIRVYDLESGPDPDSHSNGIIEIGWTDIHATSRDLLGSPIDWVVGETKFQLLNPINPIPYEVMAVHHIQDRQLIGMPKWVDYVRTLFNEDDTSDIVAYAAHNIEMEQSFITEEFTKEIPWIDTFQTALHLYPEATSHSNQSLKYMLRAEGWDSDRAFPVHRAGPDSFVSAVTLAHMLNEGNSVEHLVDLTQKPALLYWCKHRRHRDENGKPVPWTEVDSGYMRWMYGKDFSRNEFHTIDHILEQREIDQRLEYERRQLERQFAQNGMSSNPLEDDPSGRPFAPIESY